MGKLTKAQQATIDRMGRGEVLSFLSGRSAYYHWLRSADRAPSAATVSALYKRGLVFQVKDGVGSFHFELTDAGRAALKQHEENGK